MCVLSKGIDIFIVIFGCLFDFMGQGYISLKYVQFVVMDEVDYMFDMGFIYDIKKIVKQLL